MSRGTGSEFSEQTSTDQRWHTIRAVCLDMFVLDPGAAFGVVCGPGLGDDDAFLTSQDESSNELTLDGEHLAGLNVNLKPI